MIKEIERWLEHFTKITKEECDYIESLLILNDAERAAFFLAKRIFEGDEVEDA